LVGTLFLADGSGFPCGDLLFGCEPGVIGLGEQVNSTNNGKDGAGQGTDGNQWRCYNLLAGGAQGDVHLFDTFVVTGRGHWTWSLDLLIASKKSLHNL
jgi:hypothetical protein